MHMVIYTLVEASTRDDAVATGKAVFDRLVGADPHTGAVFLTTTSHSIKKARQWQGKLAGATSQLQRA